MTPNKLYLAETIRGIHNNMTVGMNIINDNYIEHRYEQRGAEYTLRSWREREMTVTESMVERPDWLVKIIDLARQMIVAVTAHRPVSPGCAERARRLGRST